MYCLDFRTWSKFFFPPDFFSFFCVDGLGCSELCAGGTGQLRGAGLRIRKQITLYLKKIIMNDGRRFSQFSKMQNRFFKTRRSDFFYKIGQISMLFTRLPS